MDAKEAKKATKDSGDAKAKKKSDYDKLTEAEKQTIRDTLVNAAIVVIDANISAASKHPDHPASSTKVFKSDALLADMDSTAISQLIAHYTTVRNGDAFVVADNGAEIIISWPE